MSNVRATIALVGAVLLGGPAQVMAQGALGSAQAFGVLGASAVTNTGATTIKGNLGVYPGSSITGLGTITLNGTVHQTDGVAQQAQADALTAYNSFASLPFTSDMTGVDLGGGMVLIPGVYFFSTSAQLNGALFLDFASNPGGRFVFQIGSTLTTASASSVSVLHGSALSEVYWQVGSSATLGTSTAFEGNILADQSITLNTSATIICGRAIALNAAVTMDNNTISNDCTQGGDYGSGHADYGSLGFSGGNGGGPPPPTTIPEPSTLTLLGFGCVGLVGFVRRRRRN